jgi:tRNA pseudouridine38-40 synthase
VPYWRFVIEADRFLRNMVRAIVGTLLEVGRGRRSTDEFASLILPPQETRYDDSARESRRSEAGESVPGHALFLTDIRY